MGGTQIFDSPGTLTIRSSSAPSFSLVILAIVIGITSRLDNAALLDVGLGRS